IGSQTLEHRLGYGADVLRTAVQPVRRPAALESKLGGDHDAVADRREGLADELLVRIWTVRLGRVEEGDAALNRRADERDSCLLVDAGSVAEVQAHTPEPEGRYFQPAVSEFSALHHSLIVTVFTSVYCCMPYSPSSRPIPLCLKPPNGAAASNTS